MELEMAHLRTQRETTITDLPTEILNTIVSFLPRDTHLVQIALVSKQFKDSAERFLYRSIYLCLDCDRDDDTCILDRCFFRLVETLTRNSNRRRFVVALHLQVLLINLSVFSHHDQLLTLLPSLKELTVHPPPPHLSLQGSKRLETLCFIFCFYAAQYDEDMPEQDRVDPLEIVARHFWIPTLRFLQLDDMYLHRVRRGHLFPEARYRTSSITDLRLWSCRKDNLDILPDILLSVKRLERLIVETEWSSWNHFPAESITPDWFARTLQPHQSTLVDLVIAGRNDRRVLRKLLIGSLAGYINLKRLGIPESSLVQSTDVTIHERLPPSLEVQQLQFSEQSTWDVDSEVALQFEYERMEHLAEHKLACLPALTRVIWWYEPYFVSDGAHLNTRGEPGERWNQLASKFNEVGVKFEFSGGVCFDWTILGKDTQWKWFQRPL
jgi:hypothetical protein